MMEKAYSLFLCVLFISVLFLPSTAAGRALLQTAQTEGEGGYHGGNGGSKIGIHRHPSSPASSRTGASSPPHATPSGGNGGSQKGVTPSHSSTAPSRTGVSSPSGPITVGALNHSTNSKKAALSCGRGKRYAECMPRSSPAKCASYKRNCK
ncbi:uncharacterized protein LOC117932577 [Vitis riparia]|uniref:uncharacterized protein LOC117932577 n=1 Tax=Vitis riparia TaxID=96939 RepID=UPI00155AEA20|nr:uncharacterized protein LOC117932577 [Vitis riparia]